MVQTVPIEERVYPERILENEKISIHYLVSAHRDIINYFGFGGKQNFTDFRILVIGSGEIGDNTLMLAETFKGTDATIIHADTEQNYLNKLKERLSIRHIEHVECIHITQDSLEQLKSQTFDLICSTNFGSLDTNTHDSLKLLEGMLNKEGLLSLQFQARHTSYQRSAIKQLLNAFHATVESVEQKIERVKYGLDALKDQPIVKSFLEKNPILIQNDTALYHALIKPEEPERYSIGDIFQLAEQNQFKVTKIFGLDVPQGNYAYNPRLYMKDEKAKTIVESASEQDKAQMAEILNGKMHHHHVYLSRQTVTPPSISEKDSIPFLLFFQGQDDEYQSLFEMMEQYKGKQLSIKRYGSTFGFPVPTLAPNLVKFIDGKRSVKEIIDSAYNSIEEGTVEREQLVRLLNFIFEILNSQNWMLLARNGVERSETISTIQVALHEHYKQQDIQEQEAKLDKMIQSDSFSFDNL
ncbi:MAG: hypothetical protein MK137_07550 [Rickettsiales bacterium]|nr:hypothetical protein [Rickettsiales bacterium]